MPGNAGRKPKAIRTVTSLCGAAIALLTACKTADDSQIAYALERPATALVLVSYGTASPIASDAVGTELSFAKGPDDGPPSVEPAVYRYETAPRWEFAENVNASRPRP